MMLMAVPKFFVAKETRVLFGCTIKVAVNQIPVQFMMILTQKKMIKFVNSSIFTFNLRFLIAISELIRMGAILSVEMSYGFWILRDKSMNL